MGELFICNEPIAALPYYIEGISWNVYSLMPGGGVFLVTPLPIQRWI